MKNKILLLAIAGLLGAASAHATTTNFGVNGFGGAAINTSWTAPAGVTSVKVEMWGGGGAGGNFKSGNTIRYAGAGGGGGGAYTVSTVTVVPGNSYAITVGGGGLVGSGNNADGLAGGDSTFQGATTAFGGAGGIGNASAGGAGGTVTGTGNYSGGPGGKATTTSGGNSGSGGGSGSATAAGNATGGPASINDTTPIGGSAGAGGGPGAGGQTASAAGSHGSYPGGGGAGAYSILVTAAKTGGAGGNGQVILTYFSGNNKLAVTSVPGSATAGANFSVTVQAQDGGGNPLNVTADTAISLTASGTGTLSGNTATITAGNNSVTLTTVQYTKAESITLTAARTSGDTLDTSAASSAFTVVPAAASQLVFSTQPSASSTISVPFVTQPVVQIRDALGNVVTTGADATATVALTLTTGTGTLGGTTNMAAVAGVANFAGQGLNIDAFGTNKVLTATATLSGPGVVTTTTSPAFAIIRNPALEPLRWAIDGAGDWDTTTPNWKDSAGTAATATSTDQLRFDDTYLTGTTTVSVIGSVTAASVTVSNATYDYTLNGSGNITGATALTKAGAAQLTLAGTNTYSGGTTLTTGTLNINFGGSSSANSAIGTNTLTINGGTIDNTSAGAVTLLPNNPVSLGAGPFAYGGSQDLNLGTGAVNLVLPPNNTTRIITLGGSGRTLTFGGASTSAARGGDTTNEVDGAGNTLVFGSLGLNASVAVRNNAWSGSANVTVIGGVLDNASGGQKFTYVGTGIFTIGGVSTYTGNTTISSGKLALSGNGSIATTPRINIATNATFDVSGITPGSYTNASGRTLAFTIDKTGGNLAQGRVLIGAKTLTYGGTLTVTSTGSDAPANGDSYALVVTNGTPGQLSGWFSSVSVPVLPSGSAGLSWDTNKLATGGVLDIYNFTTTNLTISTPVNSNAVIIVTKLAAYAHSDRGTPQLAAGTQATLAGGSATVDGSGNLTYAPPTVANTQTNFTDSFTNTFLDGHGWQTLAVSVSVGSISSGNGANAVYAGVTNGIYLVKFAGLPGYTYTVETNGNLNTTGWVKEINYMAPTNNDAGFGIGVFGVTNSAGYFPGLYLRTVWPAY